jgi:hypothetical protein
MKLKIELHLFEWKKFKVKRSRWNHCQVNINYEKYAYEVVRQRVAKESWPLRQVLQGMVTEAKEMRVVAAMKVTVMKELGKIRANEKTQELLKQPKQ